MERPPAAERGAASPARLRRLVPCLLVALWAALYLAAARRAAGEFGFPLDDAWIHARMARNLAGGAGMAFNPGSPAATATAPLWTLLLAVPAAAGVPFPWASCAAGVLATALLAWLTVRLLERGGSDGTTACLAGIVMVSTHPFPWAAVSGMEAPLAASLVVAILCLGPARRPVVCLLMAGLAALARPELLLLPGLVLADLGIRAGSGWRRRTLFMIPLAAAVSCAPLLLNRVLSGSWLPGALAAKVGRHGVLAALAAGRPDQILPVVASNLPSYLASFLGALASDNLALLLLAPFGIARLARGERGSHLPWMLLLVQPCAMAILAPFGGLAYHEQRYIAPLVALMAVAGGAALAAIPGLGRRGPWLRLGAGTALLVVSTFGAWKGMARFAVEVANITRMQVTVARWLQAQPGGPGLVATNDIGAIGFFTGAPILDTTGLASPEVLPYLRRPAAPGAPTRGWNGANEAALLEFLAARRPRYVALFPSWYPSLTRSGALGEPVYRVDLQDNLICGDRTMLVFRPAWSS